MHASEAAIACCRWKLALLFTVMGFGRFERNACTAQTEQHEDLLQSVAECAFALLEPFNACMFTQLRSR